MTLSELLQALAGHGIKLSVEGERLAVESPTGEIPGALREQLVANKAALLTLLAEQRVPQAETLPQITPRPEARHEPFPMTEIQQAYSVGRQAELEMNAAMHAYNEIDCHALDLARFEEAWNLLVARHEMLRVVALPGFQQRILPEVPRYALPVEDLRGRVQEEAEARFQAIRARLSQQVLALDQWPLFELRVCQLDGGRSRLFMSIDGTFIDGYSFQILYRELVHLYKHLGGAPALPQLDLSFRDYALAVQHARGARYARSLEYWRSRLPNLPPAPDLPLERDPGSLRRPRFGRVFERLGPDVWQPLKQRARARKLTEPELLLAAYAEVMARWSRSPRFTLNVPHFNRLPLHPQVNEIVGTFASFTLIEVDHRPERSFTERALAIRDQLFLALEHREVSGVELLRELFRAQGRISGAIMPVVMTSFASHSKSKDSHWVDFLAEEFGELVEALTQTPQVWIDLQIVYQRGGVFLNWDVAEELFPPGMIDDMFSSFCALLRRLAEDDAAWDQQRLDTRPARQVELLARVNDTARPQSGALLHTGFFRNAAARPEALALASSSVSLTYGELSRRSSRLAHALRERGAAPNRIVAIVMEKGWEQVVAALGVLGAGAAYLPIDSGLPQERRAFMMKNGGATLAVTQPKFAREAWPEGVQVLVVTPDAFSEYSDAPPAPVQRPEDLAHILYTSGSTGQPNGAMLTHAGMVNGVEWTNRRFGVGPDDRVIALSALHHDFSVYDVFGTLSAGAAMVMPDASSRRDPSHWAELMGRHGVSIWSTVPAMMEMLLTYLEGSNARLTCPLRLVMLGGDWLPVTMPSRLRAKFGDVKLMSVGGPTETSLWNISHPVAEVDERRRSIPYGKPISNTKYYVLDEHLDERPVWVPGELCCAGVGVAQGYVGAGAGSKKFTVHPRTGERIYRTGDLGRYLPDGTIEFLGRVDFQLSIRGQRIEPGEIEAALLQEASISAAVVGAVGEHHEKRLVAYVVPSDAKRGIDTRHVREFLSRKLPEHLVPATYVVLEALPLTRNAKVDRKALPHPDAVAKPTQREERKPAVASRPGREAQALQESIAKVVAEVLGVPEVHPDRNFFELGANSVHLIKLHLELKEKLGRSVPVTDLFGRPTVKVLAARLAAAGSEAQPEAAAPLAREEAPRTEDARDIAIIGMSCRFPGASTPEQFWRNLMQGVESVGTFTDEELLAAGVSPEAFRSPGYVRSSAVMEDFDAFDAEFFSLTPREARALDPQQRVFLECAWEALEHAGYPPSGRNGLVGVYAGKSVSHYRYPYPDLTRPIGFFQDLMAQDKDFLATQVSYKLDLRGPSINIQTACSTSLVAVSAACAALVEGSCDLALAGGVAIKVPHRVGYLYEEGSVFSRDGHCRPFDAGANGTIPGSGAGIVVLKRLSRALADGDRVLAVIKGSAINNDGHRKVGFMAPGVDGQTEVVRRAHQHAKVDPRTISYVEAHGTGTAIGDPIEVAALTEAFGAQVQAQTCGLGSVKGNIGHLDSAAGIAGLIKVVLALQHRTLPPTLHYQSPNPRLELHKTPFYVVDKARPWTAAQGVLRAGLSSFGIGGTNAHLVLEEAPPVTVGQPDAQRLDRSRHLLALSARSPEALRQLAGRYRAALEAPDASLADVCFSANTGRIAFDHRIAVVGADAAQVAAVLSAAERAEEHPGFVQGTVDAKQAVKVAFLFSGQGSQYVGAARELYQTHAGFRRRIDSFDELLREYWDRSLISVLYAEPGQPSPIDQLDYAQPVVFVLEYALAELWMSWGVQPDVLLGHSTGELAAACIAGVFSVEDGLKLAVHRGRLIQQLPEGSNIAVSAAEPELRAFLAEGGWASSIAAVNGPDNVVISGIPAEIDEIGQALEARGYKVKRLNIPRAAHSVMMEAILPEFRAVASTLRFSPPSIPMVSGMTGELITDALGTPDYWCSQLRNPVRFARGVETVYRDGVRVFVEVGPKATLLGMAARSLPEGVGTMLPSLRADDGGWRQMLESLAALYVRGVPVDWAAVDAGYPRRKVAVPTYAFQRQRYWEEGAGLQRPNGRPVSRAEHPLIGERVPLAVLEAGELLFEATLGPSAQSFLGQHRVFGTPTLPATGYVEMALAAGARLLGTSALELTDLAILNAMTFPKDAERKVQCALRRDGEGRASIRIFSRAGEGSDAVWNLHATGTLAVLEDAAPSVAEHDLDSVLRALQTPLPVDDYYQRARSAGVEFGPEFQGITELRREGEQVLARIERPSGLGNSGGFLAHPALMDACLQVVGGAYPDMDGTELYVPVNIERLQVLGSIDDGVWSHAVVRPLDEGGKRLRADVRIFGSDGALRAWVRGLELQRTSQEALRAALSTSLDEWLYARRWEPLALEGRRPETLVPSSGACLVLTERDGVGQPLAEALTRDGRTCFVAIRGTAARRIDETTFEVPDAPEALAEALRSMSLPSSVSDVIFVWGGHGADVETLDADGLGRAARVSGGGALGLLQFLLDRGYAGAVWLVSRGAQPVTAGAPLPGLAQSLLWGMARPLAIEASELDCRCVDLDANGDAGAQAELLAQEIRRRPDVAENQVAYRDGRYVARLRRVESRKLVGPAAERVEAFRADRSYLVAGGLGRLGLLTAELLVSRGARNLVLTGRGSVSPQAAERLEHLRQQGARVEYRQVDIADAEALAALLHEVAGELAPLGGVFHSAGVLDDGVLRQQRWERFETVLRPKMRGAWNLHRLTAGLPLEHFVLFSSVASLVGSAGQANHCAANAFEDALAHHRRALGLPALSINWGIWAGDAGAQVSVSEAARTPGLGVIPKAQGLRALERLLTSRIPQVGVAAIDWSVFGGGRATPYDAELRERAGGARAVERASFLDTLTAAPIEARRRLVMDFVREQVAWMRGAGSGESIDPARGFHELGIDSLAALQLKNRLQSGLGLSLPATLVFNYPTAEKLAAHLMDAFIPLEFTEEARATPKADSPVERALDGLAEANLAHLLSEQLSKMN
ncbi:hybrid non-ribosomal peptide synthetase/type I polyketide synthase [Corallococcus macrosporus]|uniref:Non-ribosomal peptide synthase/polyketide synthase n=1 Tax=Myxococcus fulvus (strain ATCC BAA-855 / HW-1) TaxID=483219 RepID=F8CN04_MYXFH|nr:hybrid non-ribosomal peptide synthetase/type I polyketide synthase [Corallococcus macrosporus]AEI67810.1 non-ribosomal peptide synthase/polyketide synthase [Corallococcus macrosporus]